MTKSPPDSNAVHYVHVNEKICNGCVLCMKACPTKAIRVKENRLAVINDGMCINCGECIRVCPRGALTAMMDKGDMGNISDHFTSVSASTVLYSQFEEGILPNDILLGLKRMGFSYVHDQTYTNEMFNVAVELFIKEHRKKDDASFPLISPVCPVVIKLIAYRFPSLLKNIPTLMTPREIVARESKLRLAARYDCPETDIKVVHITPCPSKMICIKEPVFQEHSYLDEAVAIGNIYEDLKKNIHDVDEDVVLHHSGGIGLGWGMSGGEITGLDLNCLAVPGLQETIRYLEKIEMGLLNNIDYIEFRTCAEGCLGGPYTVADKYQAKHNLQKLIHMFGVEKRIKYSYVKKLYDRGWFFTDKSPGSGERELLQLTSSEISKGIDRQNSIEEILRLLPRKECGACGCPDCATFAEDVVDGRTSLQSCHFLKGKRKS